MQSTHSTSNSLNATSSFHYGLSGVISNHSGGTPLASARYQRLAGDMTGRFTQIPVKSFLDLFLPPPRLPLPSGVLTFAKGADKNEQTWAETLNRSGLFPNLTFKDTKDTNVVTNRYKSRPDITAFKASESEPSEPFHNAALVIERKRANEDPFSPKPKTETDVEKPAQSAQHVRGQLATYAMLLHDVQPRVFSFQLLLIGTNARILRWDRTGVIVSDLFNWMQGPTLYDFFSRFHAADDLGRGLDVTAHPAEEDDIAKARTAFESAGFKDTPATKKPFYVYEVPSLTENAPTQRTRSFIAGRPVAYPHVFTGRATTGYICYEKETGGVHFMKDAWRLLGRDAPISEAEVYGILNKAGPVPLGHPDDGEEDYFRENDQKEWLDRLGLGPALGASDLPADGSSTTDSAVPHVATLMCGDDVSDANGLQQTFDHSTLIHEMVPLPSTATPPPQDGRPPRRMQQYAHFRLVLKEVGQPLAKFNSVRNLLQVLLDVVEAHSHARHRGVLHRDISANNVLIVEDNGSARGLLIDWDLALVAKKAGSQGPPSGWVTGTWQFMSIALREAREGHIHTTKDDLESIFWLLLYMLGRYTDLIEGPAHRVADIMTNCFDRTMAAVQHPDRPQQMEDGRSKTQTLTDIADFKGYFIPAQIHRALRPLLETLAGSLHFFLEAKEATSAIRKLSPVASETQPGARAELERPRVLSRYRQEDLELKQQKYDDLKAFRRRRQVCRYQTFIEALQSARDDFDTVTDELRKDPDLFPGGVIRGATFTGDRYPDPRTRPKETLTLPGSGAKKGSKRSASERDEDINIEDEANNHPRKMTSKHSLRLQSAPAEATHE